VPALPLGEEEIAQFGLPFRKQLFTRPFINDAIVDKLFGLHADYVRQQFLHRLPYGLYALKDEVDTQVKVRDLFGNKNDENSLWIRDGLYRLLANVLFVEDMAHPGMYHPRIMAYREPVYDVLSTEEKEAYMRIYNHFFFERHREFWQYIATRKMGRVFAHTTMMLCAENIGAMPDGYEQVLDHMRILSLVMQSLPQRYDGEFAHVEAWPYLSLCTTSTHDMPTLRMWWEENAGRTQRFYATMLQKQGRAPKQLPAHIAEEIVARLLYGPSMLCVLPIQDWLAIDSLHRSKQVHEERINAPYDPYNQWRYRMELSVDALKQAEALNKRIRIMITRSGR
jgi:4-alpha-glucanotransferase